ncbi:unnamed protein product [Trichobilharzia regenti]|nr:unnamed protein product [Trichobilharzia regenti]
MFLLSFFKVALATLLHNVSVLIHRTKTCSVVSNLLPQLRFTPGVCVRICFSLLSLPVDHGSSGVTQFHPDAVNCLFLCLGNCLSSVTAEVNMTDEQIKAKRVRVVASAVSGLKGVDDNVNTDTNVDEFKAWESARKIISYWATTPTVCPKVRACASQVLSILE